MFKSIAKELLIIKMAEWNEVFRAIKLRKQQCSFSRRNHSSKNIKIILPYSKLFSRGKYL